MNSGTPIAPRARTSRAIGYVVAAVIAGVFIVATGYFTLNMIAMAMLTQALGQ